MSPTERGAGRSQRGQATTETILLSWIMVVFFASMYQIFLVNHTIYRSLAAVHQQLFEQGFQHNCLDDNDFCRYKANPHTHAYVVWRTQDIPEIQVQVVGLLGRFGLEDPLLLESNLNRGECPKCKKSQMGAGPEGPGDHVGGIPRFFSKVAWSVTHYFRFIPAYYQRLNG
jgi:hypothetical protein